MRGIAADDPRVTVFRGIPFAKPPLGRLRWHAPEPADDWEGVRDCVRFAPIPMQDQPGVCGDIYCREFHVDPDVPISEDCLYINVWTGAKSTDDKLPVLLWLYGGAFQWGYTSEPEFNGEKLARRGVIVVSAAYRLGAYGFLAHPTLSKEDPKHPTNFGLLDQKAALTWVYKNIAAFGGDPDNITLAGQSAGGASVMHALVNKEANRMIKNAAIFSGLIRDPFMFDDIIMPKSLEAMEDNGKAFIEYLGCSSIDEARDLSAEYITEKYDLFATDHPRFVPCIDGKYMMSDSYDELLAGNYPDIPVMTGYTNDEFMTNIPARADLNDSKYKDVIKADIFENGVNKRINIIQNSVRNVSYAHMRNRKSSPLYTYRFRPSVPGDDAPGCFHSCDLWFFFDTIDMCSRPYTGVHFDLASKMCDYFSNFIKSGDPNGMSRAGERLPVWNKTCSENASEDEMQFT